MTLVADMVLQPAARASRRPSFALFTFTRLAYVVAGLAMLSSILACQSLPKLKLISGYTMGTYYRVTYLGEVPSEGLQEQINKVLSDVNQSMSTYYADSSISKFNKFNKTAPFPIDAMFAEVMQMALAMAKKSNGYFDPTVGPLVELWGFGPGADRGRLSPPQDINIAQSMQAVGWQKLQLTLQPAATLYKSHPALHLDLSAIAKGYAVDLVAQALMQQGLHHHLVDIGGELRATGFRDGKTRPWVLGIESPLREKKGVIHRSLKVANLAMATSGDYRNYFEHEGIRYSHTLDPKSGRPVTHTSVSVTVLARSCMEADALATALLAMGSQKGIPWANENQVACLFLDLAKEELVEKASQAFVAFFPQVK